MKKEKNKAHASKENNNLCPVCGHFHEAGTCCMQCGCLYENGGYTLEEEKIESVLPASPVSFLVFGPLLIFAFLLSHQFVFPSLPFWVGPALCLLTFARFGLPVVYTMLSQFTERKFFTESTLMSVATLGAVIIGEFAEAAAVVFLYSLGEYLSDLAFDRSKDRIASLLDLSEKTVRVRMGEKTFDVCPAEVKVGDILVLHAGEKVTLDGVITSGSSLFDTSGITGESLPAFFETGDRVLSGTICLDGGIEMRAEKPYNDCVASKLAAAVTEAGRRKSKNEAFIRTFSRYYTPVMMGVALAVFAVGALVTKETVFWLKKALTVLVISCPCALVLSVPLAYFASIGAGAKLGVMFKGGEAVDAASRLCALAFDKTGTLTKADIRVEKVISRIPEEEFRAIASSVLACSSHPLAKAYLSDTSSASSDTKAQSPLSFPVLEAKEIPGKGTAGKLLLPEGETKVFFGSARFLKECCPGLSFEEEPLCAVYGATKDRFLGCILFSDSVKEDAEKGIMNLKKLGIRDMMILSGDKEEAVSLLAGKVGIPRYAAELLPEDKIREFESLKNRHFAKGTVGYVGDGINDAPVLIRSDIGFAMGKGGTALSAEAADVVLTGDDILLIPCAISIAKKTRKIVFENIVFSLAIKAVILLLTLLSSPVMALAVGADVGVTLLAVLNCLRIMKA